MKLKNGNRGNLNNLPAYTDERTGRCCSRRNDVPPTGWLMNSNNFVLVLLEAGSPDRGASMAGGGAPFWVTDFLYPHRAEGQGSSLQPLLFGHPSSLIREGSALMS